MLPCVVRLSSAEPRPRGQKWSALVRAVSLTSPPRNRLDSLFLERRER
jgi:hypothetical protein